MPSPERGRERKRRDAQGLGTTAGSGALSEFREERRTVGKYLKEK